MNYDAALERAQDAVEVAFNEYDKRLRDAATKKGDLKEAEAVSYLNCSGTVDQRKAIVVHDTAQLLKASLIADALEKSAKSALEVARDRVSTLQTRSKLNDPVKF